MSLKYNEKIKNRLPKETKWDRISKRHSKIRTLGHKSEAIKRLIAKDFIGRKQCDLMVADEQTNNQFDPVLIMDLRHKMFREIPAKIPLITTHYRKATFDSCKRHNMIVADHYLTNQLSRFRESLTKQYKHIKLKERELHRFPWLIDNTAIMNSLDFNEKAVQHFYETPLVVLKKVNILLTRHKECLKGSPHNRSRKFLNDQNMMLETTASTKQYIQSSSDTISEGFRENHGKADKNLMEVTTENILNIKTELKNINEKKENGKQHSPMQSCYFDQFSIKASCDIQEQVDEIPKCTSNTSNTKDYEHYSLQSDKNINEHCKHNNFKQLALEYNIQRPSSLLLNCSEDLDAVINEITNDALMELELEKREKQKKVENININKKIFSGKSNEPLASEEASSTTCSKFNDCTFISKNEKPYTKKKRIESHTHLNKCNILHKYFLRWVHFTTIEKIEREYVSSRADRVKKINVFLDKIRLEKQRLKYSQQIAAKGDVNTNVICRKTLLDKTKITKKYQNKIKVQQDIIDLQRIKLERQERVIMELKLSKIADESKEAKKELKKEIQDMIRTGDPKTKANAKYLQLLGNLKDEDEQDERLQSNGIEIPKFLRRMQERSLERNIKHEQVKERRLRLEAMKEAEKLAAEESRRLEDETAKRLRISQLKEKRLQEKMAKELKERERQRTIANVQKAEDFCRRRLLRRVGMEGFRQLMQRKREILRVLNELRITFYQRNCFQSWVTTYYIAKAKRDQKASELYETTLKRRSLHIWFDYLKEERSKTYVAIDWNDFKITNSTFGKWARYTETVRIIADTKMIQAASHHEWHLKWKVLDCWQRLPQILKLENETEERRQRWRLKIWELLPDYIPNRDEVNYT